MQNTHQTDAYSYFLASGRSLEAIEAHRHAVCDAIEDIQAFVMLCGAERALGGSRISGLHFTGRPPAGWVRNATAPLMAIPDANTTRGLSLLRKMNALRIPDDAEFAELIGADAIATGLDASSPIITLTWPSYEEVKNGWVIKCPIAADGTSATPPDALPLTRADYERMSVSPPFNLAAANMKRAGAH